MNKVVVYGGAFNPPTNAHQAIAQAGAEHAEQIGGSLWLLLSGDRRDKSIAVPLEKRILYGQALLSSLDTPIETDICTYELSQTETQTSSTVEFMEAAYPNTEFSWIFGSDSIQTMPKWNKGDWLKNRLKMLVVQRAGHEVELTSTMDQLDVPFISGSSTEVRQMLAVGQPVADLVPEEVLRILV